MQTGMKALPFMLFGILLLLRTLSFADVIKRNGTTYIRDMEGEEWDISQAVSLGFNPDYFEFGLGRHAFSPLNDSNLQNGDDTIPQKMRILGIAGKTETKAFSIRKLSGHEIANSTIDNQPVAAAY